MKEKTLSRLLTRHKTLAFQCQIAIGRVNAISSLLFQSYPAKVRDSLNTEPTIKAIRTLKDTMENRMYEYFPREMNHSHHSIYNGSDQISLDFYSDKELHDKANIDQQGLRIIDSNRKRHLTITEYARVWVILQAITGTFAGYQSIFTWANPSDNRAYDQAGEIVTSVQTLQEKLQDLLGKENKRPLQDREWQDVFNGLNHDCFFFEKALLVLQFNHDGKHGAII